MDQLFCETHPKEEIERICSLPQCKKAPLLCWQCLLDCKDHSEQHRQHLKKIPIFLDDFFTTLNQQIEDKQKSKDSAPSDFIQIIEDEDESYMKFAAKILKEKENIKSEIDKISEHFNNLLQLKYNKLSEILDKQLDDYKSLYKTVKEKIEENFGLNKILNRKEIEREINDFKENNNLNNYFLNLKAKLLQKPPLQKDPSFATNFQNLKRKIDNFPNFIRHQEFQEKLEKITVKLAEITENISQIFPINSSNSNTNNNDLVQTFNVKSQFKSVLLESAAYSSPPNESRLFQTVKTENKKLNQLLNKSNEPNFKLKLKKQIHTSHLKQINAVKSITQDLIATASKDKKIKIWSLYSGECVATLEGHKDNVCALEVLELKGSNNLSLPLLISGGGNFESVIIVWDLERKKLQFLLKGHQSSITTLSSLYNGRSFASGSYDNKIIIWDAEEGNKQIVLDKHNAMISIIISLTDINYFASASWDKRIIIWKLEFIDENIKGADPWIYINEEYAILALANSILYPSKLIYGGTNK